MVFGISGHGVDVSTRIAHGSVPILTEVDKLSVKLLSHLSKSVLSAFIISSASAYAASGREAGRSRAPITKPPADASQVYIGRYRGRQLLRYTLRSDYFIICEKLFYGQLRNYFMANRETILWPVEKLYFGAIPRSASPGASIAWHMVYVATFIMKIFATS